MLLNTNRKEYILEIRFSVSYPEKFKIEGERGGVRGSKLLCHSVVGRHSVRLRPCQ